MDNQKLVDKYEASSRKIKQSLITTKGGAQAEAEYSRAYQNLVAAGEVMQIKKKYR